MLSITHFITFCTYETTHLFSFRYLVFTDDGKKKARRTADLSKAGDAIEKRARERGLNTEQLTRVIEIITQRNLCKSVLGVLTIIHLKTVSILGFENCQSFFSATAHVRCTAPARPTPHGRCRSALLAKRHCDRHISLQHANNCIKNTIVSLVYIKLVVYYNKRSWKSRGIADLKRNP